MTLSERLANDLKQAMKERDKVRLSVLRMVKSAMQNAAIEARRELTEEEILAVVRREVKQRGETLATIAGGGREETEAEIRAEIAVLQDYLPAQLDEDDLRRLVLKVVDTAGATSKADMGRVMPLVMKQVAGRADGKTVNRLVQEILAAL